MSGGSQNTVSQQTVPSWVQPYLTQALSAGQGLEQSGGPQYYPGNQVAPLSGLQQAGLSSIGQTAGAPGASQGASLANQFETSGALLNPSLNPYLQGTYTQAAQAADNQIQSQFGANGSNVINSLPVMSDENNNLATQLYGGAYNTGLQNMTQASALAPGIQQGTYLPGQEELGAGGTQQSQAQNMINAAMQYYNYNAQLPYNTLSWYSGLLGQNASPFAGASSSGTSNNSSALTDIGGATALYGLGSDAGLFSAGGGLAAGTGGAAADATAADAVAAGATK